MANELIPTTKIAVFREKEIRKTIATLRSSEGWKLPAFVAVGYYGGVGSSLRSTSHNNQWWFLITENVKN